MFKVIEDIKLADELYLAGLLWWDAYTEMLPCHFGGEHRSDYYIPSNYRKQGANCMCNFYLLIEE